MPPSAPYPSPRNALQTGDAERSRRVAGEALAPKGTPDATEANRRDVVSTAAVTPSIATNPMDPSFSSPLMASNSMYSNPGMLSSMGGYGGAAGMYGGGGYGAGMGGMGGMMSPYYGGMMPTAGPLSGLNQLLFGVQSVIFSLGQAVQIIGMNTQAVRQLLESASSMFDHATATYHEMQALEERSRRYETEEERKRRRRLRAMRMTLVAGISYLGYRLLRRLFFPQRHPAAIAGGYPPSSYSAGGYPPSSYSPGGYPPPQYSSMLPYGPR
jgi:hypothetical protein